MSSGRREIPLPYYPLSISRLRPGSIQLGVPLCRNVIQVGLHGAAPSGRISVVTDVNRITTISRSDGSPLQAEVIDENGMRGGRAAHTVFTEPVASFSIGPGTDTGRYEPWRIGGEDLEVADMIALQALTGAIGSYALSKIQRLEDEARRAAAGLIEHADGQSGTTA